MVVPVKVKSLRGLPTGIGVHLSMNVKESFQRLRKLCERFMQLINCIKNQSCPLIEMLDDNSRQQVRHTGVILPATYGIFNIGLRRYDLPIHRQTKPWRLQTVLPQYFIQARPGKKLSELSFPPRNMSER